MSQNHNVLAGVTQQDDHVLHQMKERLKSFMDLIDLMAEYNPGSLQIQISEQLEIFQDRVTIIIKAI
jgi:hypothetical protein